MLMFPWRARLIAQRLSAGAVIACPTETVWGCGEHDTVALRVSTHPIIQSICAELGEPIVSTSANPTGKTPARTALRLRQYFPTGLDLIVSSETCNASAASEIRNLRTGKVVREGDGS